MKLSRLSVAFLSAWCYGADFAADIYPVLQKGDCAGCHNHDGVASGTRLKFPEGSASSEAIAAFGQSLRPLVDTAAPEKSLLVLKPTRVVPHAGGKRMEPGSPEATKLIEWARTLAVQPAETTSYTEKHQAAGPVLRRLTHAQYNNTIRDLLGDDSRIADSFPPEDFVNGFRNQYQAQSTSPLLA